MNFQITPERFYTIGGFSFVLIGIFNCITLWINWSYMLLSQVFSSAIGIIFNLAVAGFFYYLLETQVPTTEEGDNIEELKEMVEGLKNGKRPRNN